MKNLTNITVLAIFISLTGCYEDDIIADSLVESPDEIQSYFKAFEEEALQRGLNYDVDSKNIYGEFADLPDNTVGQCSYSPDQPRKITLDQNYWNRASELEKEYLVFHELGHCYLEKLHNDNKNEFGACVSIMNSGTSDCRNIYNSRNRSEFIDELFDIK
ncbi:putative metallopeptidase [Membranihabitans marinus]|uniref:putative metallopeptidase n=1 Tax=Membranihabitans marinus TaxID=1227546 RepID=UPI001F240CBF|nr:putative metallopeptidase [Membranihabitans marinus]